MKKKQEVFKSIEGYPMYAISKKGDVLSLISGKILKSTPMSKGYPALQLCKDGVRKTFLVHRLNAFTWYGKPPAGYVVDHKDDNKTNYHLDNLQYLTYSENTQKYYDNR